MTKLKAALFSALLIAALSGNADAAHPCAGDARVQAKKLLIFHFDNPDEKITMDNIADEVKVLKPLKNPAGKGQFDVLEVSGYIYKAEYRLRFLYALIDKECILMGQEILQYADVY